MKDQNPLIRQDQKNCYQHMSDLKKIGFRNWFQERVDNSKLKVLRIARVSSVHKDSYHIHNGSNEIPAEITGKLMFNAESAMDLPTVGDWIYAQYLNEDSFAIIHDIFPRKTVLKRKTAGKRTDFQLIAANIDTAMIVQSLDTNYNLRRMERYLAMIAEGRIAPVVLLSKCDLADPKDIHVKIEEVQRVTAIKQVTAFSNKDGSGFDQLLKLLCVGQTYCLLGSSGVGKTTLLNKLVGSELFETKPVREKDGKGRHATSRRQLICLNNNVAFVDTPGMRELGNIGVETGIQTVFDEIVALSDQCRFANCTHTQEVGCAILQALEKGALTEDRYRSFMKLSKESAYYESSYLEKRKKDKAFGKLVKSVMKHKKMK